MKIKIIILHFLLISFSVFSQETDEFDKLQNIFRNLNDIRTQIFDISLFNNNDLFIEYHKKLEIIINQYIELKEYYNDNEIISIIDFSINNIRNIQLITGEIDNISSHINIILRSIDSVFEIYFQIIYLSYNRNNDNIIPNFLIENEVEINIDFYIREIIKIIYTIKYLFNDLDVITNNINYNARLKWINLINEHINTIQNMNEILLMNTIRQEQIHVTTPMLRLLVEKTNNLKNYVEPSFNYYILGKLDEIIDMYTIIRRLFNYFPINEDNSWI